MPRTILPVAAGLLVLTIAACGDDDPAPSAGADQPTAITLTEAVIDPGDRGEYRPTLRAQDAVVVIDNLYFPVPVGARWVYEGTSDGAAERVEVEVLTDTRRVMGIDAVVVRDRAYINGELAEDTLDFFIQDRDGNVWYLGEETAEYENGVITNTAGSFQAGVDGALPGLIMPVDPKVGDAYRQEFYPGQAEDMGEIITVGGTATVPFGTFVYVLIIHDWTPLEPDVVEEKRYAPGVGLIAAVTVEGGEATVELVEYDPGP